MPWSILHRYVMLELLRVFLLALAAITSILVMAGLVAEASKEGLGPSEILQLIPLLIPGTLPYTIPATTLFAVSVVYGRLAADNELTAIKSAGIPVSYVLWPALVGSALLGATVFWLYQDFIPRNLHRFRTEALQNIEDLLYARLRRDGCFNEPKVNYSIFVQDVQGRRLLNATFKKRDPQGRDEIIAKAREAELKVDLQRGIVSVHMLHGDVSRNHGDNTTSFEREVIPVPLPPIGAARQMRAREMTNAQIAERRAKLVDQRAELVELVEVENSPKPADGKGKGKKDVKAHRKEKAADGDDLVETPEDLLARLPPKMRLQFTEREIRELDTEYATRPALAMGSFFFAVIGCPVAIWFHRRDYLSAFVTCFLPIVITYYPLVMFGVNLGKEGRLDPLYGMWTGNAILGLAGLGLFIRLLRR